MPLTEQEENILRFAEESLEYLKRIPPNLKITDMNLENLCRKYDVNPFILIKFIQEILNDGFENGILFGNIKFYHIEPLLENKINLELFR